MKGKSGDIILRDVHPEDSKESLTPRDLAEALVQRLGLQRKKSTAQHADLMNFLLEQKKAQVPVDINQIAKVLSVSTSQAYEEIRKWRSLRVLEAVKVPVQGSNEFMKGYMLSGITANQLVEKAQSSANAFFRTTKRLAKDFDDLTSAETARAAKQ